MITLVIESLPSAYCWSIEGQHVDSSLIVQIESMRVGKPIHCTGNGELERSGSQHLMMK